MRPLLRYTIGSVHESGFELLSASVRSFRRLYPDFDIVIAHNNLNEGQESFIRAIGTELHRQVGDELPVMPDGVAWKLYPPRLRPDGHEIVMDNDILITGRLKEIEDFLSGDQPIITADRFKLLGRFEDVINRFLNSGFYGMPPGYDFQTRILETLKEHDINTWEQRFDEQGLVAKIIGEPPVIIVPLETINILEGWNMDEYHNPHKGLHFVGTNRGDNFVWNEYKKYRYRPSARLLLL